jgi:hypothetical protein
MIRVIPREILTSLKLLVNSRANALVFASLIVFTIFIAVGGSIAFNIILRQHQARAAVDDLANSLSDIIRNKVANTINKSLSAINEQPSSINDNSTNNGAITNNKQTTIQSSISGANKSTNLNCTNGRCIATTCTDNNCTTTIQNPSRTSAQSNVTTITIGEPFYTQTDKPTNQKAAVVNGVNSSEISFSGNGTANGINFKDTGKASIVPRAGEAAYIRGNVEIVNINNSSEKATYTFEEIGHRSSDGSMNSNGAAFFGSNATGKLAFLNNAVLIYENQIDKAGNSKTMAWKWK